MNYNSNKIKHGVYKYTKVSEKRVYFAFKTDDNTWNPLDRIETKQ